MFIRVKRVKKSSGKVYEYAHLVHGIWRKRRQIFKDDGNKGFRKFDNSVHKYNKFLGRVYRFGVLDEKLTLKDYLGTDFENFVNDKDVESVYNALLSYELIIRGFKKRKKLYYKNNLFVDLHRLIVHDGRTDAVIKINEFSGYLCSTNLESLFDIKKIANRNEGMYLLKRLRMVGIKLDADHFYILVNKLIKETT